MRFVDERPYPPTGITTADWRRLPVVVVDVHEVIFVQTGVNLDALLTGKRRKGSDVYPHVVHWEGNDYVEDGHTRIARGVLMSGQSRFLARRFER